MVISEHNRGTSGRKPNFKRTLSFLKKGMHKNPAAAAGNLKPSVHTVSTPFAYRTNTDTTVMICS
jgi:hypothetical protein